MNLFIQTLFTNPFHFFAWTVAVTFSICLHEASHAAAAYRLGDDTAVRAGHLSMNPLVQMGPTSLIMLLVLGIAWGQVPIDPSRLRGRGRAALVAFAGPAANLVLCIAFGGLTSLAVAIAGKSVFTSFFAVAAIVNGVLLVLNLLPVPMLDGWAIFSFFFPALRTLSPQTAQTVSLAAIVLLFMSPAGGWIFVAGGAAADAVIRGWSALFVLFG